MRCVPIVCMETLHEITISDKQRTDHRLLDRFFVPTALAYTTTFWEDDGRALICEAARVIDISDMGVAVSAEVKVTEPVLADRIKIHGLLSCGTQQIAYAGEIVWRKKIRADLYKIGIRFADFLEMPGAMVAQLMNAQPIM